MYLKIVFISLILLVVSTSYTQKFCMNLLITVFPCIDEVKKKDELSLLQSKHKQQEREIRSLTEKNRQLLEKLKLSSK